MEEKREYNSFSWFDTISNEDIINTFVNQKIENIVNTANIAKIIEVNQNKVDVVLLNGEKLINLPICSTAFNGYTVSLPLKKDDTGIVIFMKYEISNYKNTGEFKGSSLSAFSQNNGVFIPFALHKQPETTDDIIINNEKISITIDKNGGLTFKNEKGSCSLASDGMITFANDGGEITMDNSGNINVKANKAIIDANNIELGKNATENIVLGTTFLSQINQIIAIIKTHTHGANGGGAIPASPELAALNPMQNNILSQIVKTK